MKFFLVFLFLYSLPAIKEIIPEGPFCYPGESPREIIMIDPENSPILNKACDKILSEIAPEMSEKEILATTLKYLKNHLYHFEDCNEQALSTLLSSYEDTSPEIPLEAFLREKKGVCRHIALTTTYLLDQFIKKDLLQGKVFLIRDNLAQGRHAWTLFLNEKCAWHIDAFWEVIEDGKTEKGFATLCQKYGKEVMQKQKKRWNDEVENAIF